MEGYSEQGTAPANGPVVKLFNIVRDSAGNPLSGSPTINFTNIGAYFQALWTSDIVNVSGGLRYDRHSAGFQAFVPWLGITKSIGDFNAKVLFGQNFRAPGIANLTLNPSIKPELTTAFEVQLGYQLRYNMFVSANLFQGSIANPIVYGIVNDREAYYNFTRIGSRGVELEYFVKEFWGYINANYSFYTPFQNEVTYYSAANYGTILGFAQHKIALNASIRAFDDNFTINPSATFLSERTGYTGDDADGNATFTRYPSLLLLNCVFQYRNAFVQGLDVSVGVYDILNMRYAFVQPYRGGIAPLAGPSREAIVRVAYTLKWN